MSVFVVQRTLRLKLSRKADPYLGPFQVVILTESIACCTVGTYLRGDPQDDHAAQRHEHTRGRRNKYGAVGKAGQKDISKDKKRNYLVVSLKQDQNIQDQNMWRLEWKCPRLTVMEWLEKLEVLGKNETNRDVIRYHFQKMIEQDVLGTDSGE